MIEQILINAFRKREAFRKLTPSQKNRLEQLGQSNVMVHAVILNHVQGGFAGDDVEMLLSCIEMLVLQANVHRDELQRLLFGRTFNVIVAKDAEPPLDDCDCPAIIANAAADKPSDR